MEINSIEKFLNANTKASTVVNIHFKNRPTVTGIFISHNDYSELKAKNFWRLVVAKNIDKWKKDKNIEWSRLFHGSVFTKLSVAK
jgi:hypothetical protein